MGAAEQPCCSKRRTLQSYIKLSSLPEIWLVLWPLECYIGLHHLAAKCCKLPLYWLPGSI